MAAIIQVKVVVDKSSLAEINSQIAALSNKSVNLKVGGNLTSATKKVTALNEQLGKLESSKYTVKVDTSSATSGLNKLQSASSKANTGLNNILKTASKYATWYALGTAITTVVNAFSSAIDTMKEVDTQLTNIQKVAADADIEGISQRIYENASKYGVAAQDFAASIYEFTKAGYSETAESMAELATKTILVGDTTASVADEFLIVADTAWNMGGNIERLSTLIDEADYINNNYATSLDKLAEGFPRVASVASMAGMSAEETMAALGTITASTQETASKAGTALRALILNILGDTTTEVEDGVTVTQNQIKSLRDVLNIYAKDVVEAADATGQLIDPMEAISALSKAYKDGLLSASDLYKIESALGGKLRTNQLDALLRNFDNTYTSMMEGMKTAAGTADKEIDTMMTSWEKKVQVLQNTWTKFVAKTVDTDWIKGVIDVATSAIEAVDNLGNALGLLGGIILTIKGAKIGSDLVAFSDKLIETALAAGNVSTSIGVASVAIETLGAALSTVLPLLGIAIAGTAAAVAIQNAYSNSVMESAEASVQSAKAANQEYDSLTAARDKFESMHALYEAGVVTKEQYVQASKDLSAALGEEAYSYTSYENYVKKANAQITDSYEKATAAQQDALEKQAKAVQQTYADTYAGFLTGYTPHYDKSITEQADEIVAAYDKVTKQLANNELKGTAKENAENWVESLKGVVESYKEIEEAEVSALDTGEKKINMYTRALVESVIEQNDAADGLETWGEGFETLASRIDEATAAFERYNAQVKEQKGSKLSAESSIYQAFLEDWQNGLKGSTNVLAAEDFFFTPQQIANFAKQGVDAGEVLAGGVFQGWFSYLNENGEQVFTGGDDFGKLFSDYLENTWSDAEGYVRDAAGRIVGHFAEVGDSTSLVVDDLDHLAEMFGVSTDAITPLLEALGVYSTQVWETSDGIKALLNETEGAITGVSDSIAQVDTTAFFQGLVEGAEYAQPELNSIADKLVEMQEQGEIQLDIKGDTTDIKQQLYDTIAELETVDETTSEADVTADNSDFMSTVEESQKAAKEFTSGNYTATLKGNNNPFKVAVDSAIAYASGRSVTIPVLANTTAVSSAINSIPHEASGATNYEGGLTLVNEEGPEIIEEGNSARVANGGLPTLTYIQKGATIFNADDTRRIFDSSGVQLFNGSIKAMASGNADAEFYKNWANIHESELDLWEVSGKSVSAQVKKLQEAYADYKKARSKLTNYRTDLEEYAEYIELETKEYETLAKIDALRAGMYDDLREGIENEIDAIEKERDSQTKLIDDRISALKKEHDLKKETEDLEEKILAVQQAEASLQNAQNERTVRYFNALTGQWEWGANAKDVQSATEALKDAQDALEEAYYDQQISSLERQKEQIEETYDLQIEQWEEIKEIIAEPLLSVGDAISEISRSADSSMKATITALNELLSGFGYHISASNIGVYDSGGVLSGLGGIKATKEDELILPPEITSRMLAPTAGSIFSQRLSELGYLYGNKSLAGASSNISTQTYGDTYNFGNISLSESQAKSTTVYQLAKLSRGLRSYAAAN